MDSKELQKKLQSYVAETEASENVQEQDAYHQPVSSRRVWWKQNAKTVTLLIVALVTLFLSQSSFDVAALSSFAIGGLVCVTLGALGFLGLMLD